MESIATAPAGRPIYTRDGLNAELVHGAVKIELPQVGSSRHYLAIMAGLERIFEATPANAEWVVDVSRLRQLPMSLVSALVLYEEELGKRGKVVRFIGLRKEILPDASLTDPEP